MLLVITFAFAFYKKFFVFIVVIFFAGLLEYTTNRGQIKLNLGHVFFLAILFSKIDGVSGSLLLLVFSGFLPQLLIGNLDGKNLVALPLQAILIFLASFVIKQNFMVFGILFALINYGLLLLVAKNIGETFPERVTEIILPMILNVIYFISFGDTFVSIIGGVIGV